MIFKGFGYKVPTIEIDLTKPLEELWQNLDKDARWGVNKAEKEGLTVKEADKNEARVYYEIYREMCKKNMIKMHTFEEMSKSSDEKFVKKFFVCKKDDKIIAGTSLIEDKIKGIVSLNTNASLPDYLKFQPNNLLYWSIIEYGKNQSLKAFDLGGYDSNAVKGTKTYEINRFKERWGGKIVYYIVYSKNPLYILLKAISELLFIRNIKEKTPAKKDGI